MNAPGGLTAAAKAAWAEAVDTMTALGEDPELSRGAVRRYAMAVGQCRALELEWEGLGRPGTAPGGATGRTEAPHPLLGQILAARKQAAELGQALGLDPAGRRKLSRRTVPGSRPGTATAPDRAAPTRRTLRTVA